MTFRSGRFVRLSRFPVFRCLSADCGMFGIRPSGTGLAGPPDDRFTFGPLRGDVKRNRDCESKKRTPCSMSGAFLLMGVVPVEWSDRFVRLPASGGAYREPGPAPDGGGYSAITSFSTSSLVFT